MQGGTRSESIGVRRGRVDDAVGLRRYTACAVVMIGLCVATAGIHASPGKDATGAEARATTRASRPKSAPEADLMMRLTPNIVLGPADVRAVVQVPRHADNRLLRIMIDSGAYYRSSDVQLDGAEAPLTHYFVWKDLPAGNYLVALELHGTIKLLKSTSRQLHVIGFGFD